jgi:uncharacterized membrane protein YozB (DUF420 family)
MDGFLGTGASLASDLSLLAYIVLLIPAMLVGWGFARRKLFRPHHKLTMTTITVVNWVIIVLLMALRYANWVAPHLQEGLGDPSRLIPSVHLIFGVVAQLLATYLVILMWAENILPAGLRTRNIKPVMRITLALWLVTAILGITTYFTWYSPASAPIASPAPAATQEATVEPAPIATEEASPDETPIPEEPVPLSTEES